MVGALALKILEPFPCLIKRLIAPLREESDVRSQLSGLAGGKYLLKNAVDRASQVVNKLGSSLRSQSLALSVSEKGKSLNLIASVETPLNLIVSHFARKLRR